MRVSPRRLFLGAVAGVLAVVASLSGATPRAAMAAACPPPPTSEQPFLGWGDQNDYVLATGGDFSARSQAWTLSGGAARVADQAPDAAAHSSSTGALYLPPGSSATSPCVTAPHIVGWVRLFAKSVGATTGALDVQVIVHGSVYQAGIISAGGGWAPTPMLDANAPQYSGAATYQVRLTPVGQDAAFRVDDVYVDPLIHR
jgi:hypothetical protein